MPLQLYETVDDVLCAFVEELHERPAPDDCEVRVLLDAIHDHLFDPRLSFKFLKLDTNMPKRLAVPSSVSTVYLPGSAAWPALQAAAWRARAVPSRRLLALLTLLMLVPAAAREGAAQDSTAVPPPWELTNRAEGEPVWAPLLRLREAETAYAGSDQWRGIYLQMRAQAEAALGNHAAALRFWDEAGRARDSVGVLPEGTRAVDAVDALVAMADTARVVMVNERHHAASDRLLTLRLLSGLYERGYRYFAAETFNAADTALHERGYPADGLTGTYTDEPVFAEIVREALRLGYTLVPYEAEPGQQSPDSSLTPQQQRDRAQARNLYERIFRDDPDARVLVHAGFAHVKEEVSPRWYPMAVYFRAMSGIDPLTVDQTALGERSTPAYEHPAYRAAADAGLLADGPVLLLGPDDRPLRPAGFGVDLEVLTPRTTYEEGRPGWMTLGGRRVPTDISTPLCLDRTCFVEVRIPDEPLEAVPLDRAEATGRRSVRLFLPPGQPVRAHVVGAKGEVLQTFEAMGDARRE